ncbi:MAG: NAD(P)H-hydrate dehydratase [Thermomicrobia bacterium]|nr:NAD(P)H-hydrate dehydratase [Thermomicrobia bacterium]
MRIVTAAEMRSLEEAAFARGVEAPALMQQAGAGVARVIRAVAGAEQPGARVVVLLGPGNNGGDGVVAARTLASEGFHVSVWSLTARADLETANRQGLSVLASTEALHAALAEADIVLDAILGTGARPGLPANIASVTQMVNTITPRAARVIALDIPTGVDATTGEASDEAIIAHMTVTLGSPKRGCVVPPGSRYAGRIVVVDLGLGEPTEPGPRMTSDDDVRQRVPRRLTDAHKSDCGTLLVVAGAVTYVGAPGFVAEAAMRAGAGLATMAVPRAIAGTVAAVVREATLLPLPDDVERSAKQLHEQMHRFTAAAIGPGLGREEETEHFLARLLGIGEARSRPQLGFGGTSSGTSRDPVLPASLPLLMDADGLNWLSGVERWWEQISNPAILTPHPGEMARLTKREPEEIKRDPWRIATEFADQWQKVVVLKGGPTIIAAPGGTLWVAPGGNPALATAGTGDVLAGMIGGFLAQGLSPLDAAICGVHVGSRAAERAAEAVGVYGMVAPDLLPRIADALREIMGV